MKKFLSLLLVLNLLLGMAVMTGAVTGGQLTDGDNTIELPWDTDETVTFTYTATQTGKLYLSVTEFCYADGDFEYADNSESMNEWDMYTDFTVDGQSLEGAYYGSVEVVEGQSYTLSWSHGADVVEQSWYTLGWKAVLNLSYTDELIPKIGSEELPAELSREQCPADSIEIPAGGSAYYVLKGFAGAQFLVTGANAQVLPSALDPDTGALYAEPIKPENGVVTVPVENDYLTVRIDNVGQESEVFRLDCYLLCGTVANPEVMKPGSYTLTTEKNDENGYYYIFTAQCSGTLTLTFPETGWMGAWENVTADTGKQWFDYGGSNPVVIEMAKGDVVKINIVAFMINKMGNAVFGGEVRFTAAVDYAHDYVDGVCTHCGAAEVTALLGDINGDGRINTRDVRALLQYLAGLSQEEPALAVADFNGDGRLNVRDARAMLTHIAGME